MRVREPEPESLGPNDQAELGQSRFQEPLVFRAFVVAHQRSVFALFSRILGRGPHVEDLAQETFLRAFRAFPTFDPSLPTKVSTWLLTIATRLALDERKRRRLTTTELSSADDVPSATTPFLERQRSELRSAIEVAARELPDDQCAALVLAELHGLSLAEVASVMAIPEATAKTKVHRAREKMKESLRAWKSAIREEGSKR